MDTTNLRIELWRADIAITIDVSIVQNGTTILVYRVP